MKINRLHIALLLLALVSFYWLANAQGTLGSSPTWDVYFSPRGGATFAIRQALDNAKSSVLVQAYSFTSAPIAEALAKAHRRGVKVQVLLDKSQRTEKYSSADFLANAGISVKIDAAHAIAHNKVMIIDKEIVITGSFNFTKAAEESNAENLLVIRDKELASRLRAETINTILKGSQHFGVQARYLENWQLHDLHSEPYRSKAERSKELNPSRKGTTSRN